jgi:type IV pilus assembly protein PilB
MRIPDALVEKLLSSSKHATAKQLTALRKQEVTDKKPLQDLAVSSKLISENELTQLYAKQIRVPFIELNAAELELTVLQLLPERIARKFNTVVYDVDKDGVLLVAMEDPTDLTAKKFIKKQLGRELKIYISPSSLIDHALDRYYDTDSMAPLSIESLKERLLNNTDQSEEATSGSPVAQTVAILIRNAISIGAADIHIEPREEFVVVRYRIDGLLREVNKLPRSIHHNLTSHIKSLSNLNTTEYQAPQEGHFNTEYAGTLFTIHASTLPIIDGEKVVIKIRNQSPTAPSLSELGFWGSALTSLRHAIVQPNGMILIAGPIGSGKSVTLFSIMSILNRPNVSIGTIEDPISYRVAGINQTQVNASLGINFSSGLRALLHQDPNIIMIGEIREAEIGRLAIQAASTGHLIFSTIHAKSASDSLEHLVNMGIEPFLIASTTRVVVGQRLVRRLCQACREPYNLSETKLKQLAATFDIKSVGGMPRIRDLETAAYAEGIGADEPTLSSTTVSINRLWQARKDGCASCSHTGYRGRLGIYEVLHNSAEIQSMIAGGKPSKALEGQALLQGMIPLQIDGLIKALRGQTTIEEVIRITSHR